MEILLLHPHSGERIPVDITEDETTESLRTRVAEICGFDHRDIDLRFPPCIESSRRQWSAQPPPPPPPPPPPVTTDEASSTDDEDHRVHPDGVYRPPEDADGDAAKTPLRRLGDRLVASFRALTSSGVSLVHRRMLLERAAAAEAAEALPPAEEVSLAELGIEDGCEVEAVPHARRVVAAVESGDLAYEACPPWARSTPEVALTAAFRSVVSLRLVPDALRAEAAFMLEVLRVRGDSTCLLFSAPSLLANAEFVEAAISVDESAIDFAAPALRGDGGLWLRVVARNGAMLRVAPAAVVRGEGFLLEAVGRNASCAAHVPPSCADEGVAMAVLRQTPEQLLVLGWPVLRDPAFLERAFEEIPDLKRYKPPPKRRRVVYV